MTDLARTPLAPMRFEPPRLNSAGTGRISRGTLGVGALNEAREEGRQQALAEMENLVEHHRRARLDAEHAARTLVSAAQQLRTFDQELLEDVEQQVVALAVELAESIIGCELRAFDDLSIASARKALSLSPDRGEAQLRVNPADRTLVAEALEGSDRPGGISVVGDGSVERGSCVAMVGPLLVDAQIRTAVARIRDTLGVL
jgi:flagellar assembly protein FliH